MSDLPMPRGEDAAAMKAAAAEARADATRRMRELSQQQQEAKAELERQRAEMEAEFRRKKAELDAQIAPLKEHLAKIAETAWTLDLYLGRGEELQLLRDGAPAPRETPITIRQKVLVMAEESLLLLDGQTRRAMGMDYRDVSEFVKWLLADDANLSRVLPDEKGVVVLVPTRVPSRSGNVFEDAAVDATNSLSWWFIRNGDKLYLLTVDDRLNVGERLLPLRDEFTAVFEPRLFGSFGDRRRIEPGSDEWLAVEKKADAKRRHYMRVMLVLQGIIDRTPAWHPLPEGGVNLLSVDAQWQGTVRLVQDDDNSHLLTDGRPSFVEWHRAVNRSIRHGLRIVGNWHDEQFREMRRKDWSHPRIHPACIEERPATGVPHLLERRSDGTLVVRFERGDVWKRNVPVPDEPGWVWTSPTRVPASKRASCVVTQADSWVLPFDQVTVADLRYYLNQREDRSRSFLTMVPLLRSALAAKEAEAEAEAPFRVLLRQVLLNEGADESSVDDLLDQLVTDWKVANLWAKPLNGAAAHEKKALDGIVAAYKAQRAAEQDPARDRMVAAGRNVPGAICVARNRSGKWHAYSPALPAHDAGVFLHITHLRADGTPGAVKEWAVVPHRSASRLDVAWSSDEWATWRFDANPRHYLTGPERDELIAQIVTDDTLAVVERFDPSTPGQRLLAAYDWTSPNLPQDEPVVTRRNPLGWHHVDSAPASRRGVWEVSKDAGGVPHMALSGSSRLARHFGHYSGGSRWGDTPWWPDDAYAYPDVRPRLVWHNAALLDQMKAWLDRCEAAAAERDARARAADALVEKYVRQMLTQIAGRAEDMARAQFVLDYGSNADDLWPAHWKSLPDARKAPIHQHDIRTALRRRITAGEQVPGAALGDVLTGDEVEPYADLTFDAVDAATLDG